MKFTKMQGAGNDYIYINCFEEQVENPSALSVRLSDRRFGIGSDGIILIKPSEKVDCEMDIYNADGSRAKMCGNGIRCVAKYAYERSLVRKELIRIDTQSGVREVSLEIEGGMVKAVRSDMGVPAFAPVEIPVLLEGERVVGREFVLRDGTVVDSLTCVSMGNPHAVGFCENVDSFPLCVLGPKVEKDSVFPESVNFEMVQVISPQEIQMRVWERGSGETWACGTGTCAAVAACVLREKTGRHVLVHARGGDLTVDWDEASGHIFLQGGAAFVFDGTIDG